MANTISRKIDLKRKRLLWSEWKVRWSAASDLDTCISLLHQGFQTEVMSADEESERIKFYLSVADGHCSPSLGGDPSMQAMKAFKVLADLNSWVDFFDKRIRILPPSTVEALLYFFRPKDEKEGAGLVNFYLPEGDKGHHDMRKMNEVLLLWCVHVWNRDITFKSEYSSSLGPWPENQETCALLEEVRPCVLDILYAYGHGQLEKLTDLVLALDLVDKKRITSRVQWELFTPDCTDRLAALASRSSRLVGVHTTGERVRDALKVGSAAAKLTTIVWAQQGHLKAA